MGLGENERGERGGGRGKKRDIFHPLAYAPKGLLHQFPAPNKTYF